MRLLSVILAIGVLVWHPSLARASAQDFFKSFVSAISVAKGTAILTFSEGTFKTPSPYAHAVPIIWHFADDSRAVADFNLSDGVLQAGSKIVFEPAVSVWVKTNTGFSAELYSVSYDEWGHADINMKIDNPGTINPNYVHNVEDALQLTREPGGLFNAQPWKNMSTAQHCSGADGTNCSNFGNLIRQIDFEKRDEAHEGLAVVLRDQSQITFDANNWVVLNGATTANIEHLTYTPSDGSIDGLIDDFHSDLYRGNLSTTGINLGITSGITFDLAQIGFQNSTEGGNYLHISGGNLNLVLGVNSRISFPDSTSFVGDVGSTFQTNDFDATITNGQPDITFGPGSELNLLVRQAHLGINNTDYFDIANGNVQTSFSGEWSSSGLKSISATIPLLDVTVSGGSLALNSASVIGIAPNSQIKSSLLSYSSSSSQLSGSFSLAQLNLQDNSTIGFPDGLQITTNAGGSIVYNDANSPLTLRNGSYPVGLAVVNVPFRRVVDQINSPNFVLHDGTAQLSILTKSDNTISSTGGAISGRASFTNGDSTIDATFNLHDLNIEGSLGQNVAQLNGYFNAQIVSGLTDDIKTPPNYHTPGHDDQRIYPIYANVSQAGPIQIPDSKIFFGNDQFNITSTNGNAITTNLKFTLFIKPGCGEHEQPDDQESSANCSDRHGPNQDQGLQEVYTDTFTGCRAHLYLESTMYYGTANASLSADVHGILINVSGLSLDKDIQYDEDGCSIQQTILNIFGTDIDGKIKSMAASYLAGFNKPFHINT